MTYPDSGPEKKVCETESRERVYVKRQKSKQRGETECEVED